MPKSILKEILEKYLEAHFSKNNDYQMSSIIFSSSDVDLIFRAIGEEAIDILIKKAEEKINDINNNKTRGAII